MEWLLVCMRNHGETKHFNVSKFPEVSINGVFPVTDLKLAHDVGSRGVVVMKDRLYCLEWSSFSPRLL